MTATPDRTALVTGGNRGIGLAVARQLALEGHTVLLGSRDRARGERASEHLRDAGLDVRVVELDVEDEGSVASCAAGLQALDVHVDVLVNNAGVLLVGEDCVGDPLQVSDDVVRRTLEVNLHGPWRVCRAFVSGMVDRGYGRVVNVSSICGSVSAGGSVVTCGPAYSASKAALNVLTRSLAASVSGGGDIKVNSVCPGYVRTDLGLATGDPTLPPEDAAHAIVSLATLGPDGPTDSFFQHGELLPW